MLTLWPYGDFGEKNTVSILAAWIYGFTSTGFRQDVDLTTAGPLEDSWWSEEERCSGHPFGHQSHSEHGPRILPKKHPYVGKMWGYG